MKDQKYKKNREFGTIRIGSHMFTVTGDEYAQYYAVIERQKYIRKEEKNKKISFEKAIVDRLPLDTLSGTPDVIIEDEAIKNVLIQQMFSAIEELCEQDRFIIEQLFLENCSLRVLSNKTGIPVMTLHDKRNRALNRIKKLMRF